MKSESLSTSPFGSPISSRTCVCSSSTLAVNSGFAPSIHLSTALLYAMAVAPLVEQAQIPFISLAGAVVIVEPVKKWVFKTPHSDRQACERIFVDMKARGTAKIALIAMDRSISAWAGMRETLGDEADRLLDLLAQLASLRRDAEDLFPEARAFVRPGFDEPVKPLARKGPTVTKARRLRA